MENNTACPTCGHKEAIYIHRLNEGLVKAFCIITDEYLRSGLPVARKKFNGLGLTVNQQANLQKLQYFGLLGKTKGAQWYPTEKGLGFRRGRVYCFDAVATMKSLPISYNHPIWKGKKRPQAVLIFSLLERPYKKRLEYAQEKKVQLTIDEEE